MAHFAIAAYVQQESREELVVAHGRAVAHDRDVLPCPRHCDVDPPPVAQESDCPHTVRSDLQQIVQTRVGMIQEIQLGSFVPSYPKLLISLAIYMQSVDACRSD
jgi:hypothetical protein